MKKFLFGSMVFSLAFAILSVSFMRGISPSFASSGVLSQTVLGEQIPNVEYSLPYAGGILPDSPLWPLKALRDKLWYMVAFDSQKKANLNLLFADKRLVSAKMLFENNKPDLGLTTLTKAEKYLERAKGSETNPDFLKKLALASLKHRQIIEEEIIPIAPEDLKPEIVKALDSSKNTYKNCRDELNSQSITPPKNPFEAQ